MLSKVFKNMRFLFVVDEYRPKTSANTVCVQNLQRALQEAGISTDIICYGDTTGVSYASEFGDVYTVSYKHREGLLRKLQFFKNVFIWPLRSIRRIYSYYIGIKTMTKKHTYDAIVGVMRPVEGAVACSFFDNFILYELDSIGNNSENLYDIRKYIKYRTYILEQYLYGKAIRVYHMRSHESFYSNKRYERFRYKSAFLDLPGLSLRYKNNEPQVTNNHDFINIVYTGNLWQSIRSPKYFIDLIEQVQKYIAKKIIINFYSQGDCGNILKDAVAKGLAIDNGYVNNSEIPAIFNSSDFLLNIGNSFGEKVTSFPSKTIEYIATGKPIIHIDGGENDSATEYVKRYPNSIIIHPTDDCESNIQKLANFIKSNYGKEVSFEDVKGLFYTNTPEYTIDNFIKAIGK